MAIPAELLSPPKEFSLMPFWFWNDELSDAEILRQIADFEAHGVHGFVIHPRVGLPRDTGWMSDKLLGFMSTAIEEAARRGMKVILYDEGMYPSGSSSGQVVEKHPELACRCLALHDPATPVPANANKISAIKDDEGKDWLVIDRPVNAYIRGLHYIGDGPKEDEPPAGDILNPKTAEAIIGLVYGKFAERFGTHFGSTILGIFTDEPNALGKVREKRVLPGTTGVLEHINRLLGYDFTPHLASLWSRDEKTKNYRDDYRHAIRLRLEESWYKPLSEFCASKKIALCGHPDAGDEIGVQRFFHYPGQDLVWRFVEPNKDSALKGAESTQAKCSSSAMVNFGRRRNSNEFAGAYGHQTTFDEVKWLANWCMSRGVNLLIPHAFYYSIRGPRVDERPPQIGPHTKEWDSVFKSFADHCSRLCWVNTDCLHVCETAILTNDDRCPWPAASICLQNQRDFNYLDPHTLLTDAVVDANGISIGSMKYRLLILDDPRPLRAEVAAKLLPMIDAGRVIRWGTASEAEEFPCCGNEADLLAAISKTIAGDLWFSQPQQSLRVRHVRKAGDDYYLFFNEGNTPIETAVRFDHPGVQTRVDTITGVESALSSPASLQLAAYELALIRVVTS